MKWKSSMAYLVAILFGLATPDAVAHLDDPARRAGQDGAESASSTVAAYPAELHGTWLPPDISCATLDGAGSDAALVIQNDGLRGYEDVHLVRSVERVADTPATWLIGSELSLGGDTPGDSSNIFVLTGAELVIAGDGSAAVYRKCR